MTSTANKETRANDIDVPALKEVMQAVSEDASKGKVKFHVTTGWTGQTSSTTKVHAIRLGGETVERSFSIRADEPQELLGRNTAPNPQELLFTAMNACMLVGYVVGASVKGITLEKLEIETQGELDLRGFLGIDEKVKPGYDSIQYTVRIKGNGTHEQFQEIHDTVVKTSPNRFNMASPIRLEGKLLVG